MNIAFLSYEYPPETGGGGIGTYLELIVRLLKLYGHSVAVFTGTSKAEAYWENESVFRIPCSGWNDLNIHLPQYFIPIHQKEKFDIVEGTDFLGCGLQLKKHLPSLPFIVKLHTPLYMVDKLHYQPLSLLKKIRFILGAFKRFKFFELPKPPDKSRYDAEFDIIKLADLVSSPSKSIYQEMKKIGFLFKDIPEIIQLPVEIPENIKQIQSRMTISSDPQIVFVGRLEKRKGILDLACAIPIVLKVYPTAKFTFVGHAAESPTSGTDMISYLHEILKPFKNQLVFTGGIPHGEVFNYLEKGDIFVFPSHYESFGLACCEAMAAGKAVVGSSAGGMCEILEAGKYGVLITPNRPVELANQIIDLIENDERRLRLGKLARNRILENYSAERVIPLQIASYHKAINLSKI